MKKIISLLVAVVFIADSMIYPVSASAKSMWEKKAVSAEESKPVRNPAAELLPALQIDNNILTYGLYIPEAYGTTQTCGEGDRIDADRLDKGLVVIVEDTHCNYEAQKNIQSILDLLNKDYGVNLIGVEGAAGKVDASIAADCSDEKCRKDTADKYLKNGWLTAAESLAMQRGREYGFTIWGIEDLKLYLEDIKSFRDVYNNSESSVVFLDACLNSVKELKPKIYSKELLQFDQMIAQYRSGGVQLSDLLENTREKIGTASDRNLRLAYTSSVLEKRLNIEKLEAERLEMVKDIQKRVTQEDLEEIIQMSFLYKLNKLSGLRFYKQLWKYLDKKDAGKYKNSFIYLRILRLHSRIDSSAMMKELDRVIDAQYKTLLKTPQEEKLYKAEKSLLLISQYTALEIKRGDYGEINNGNLSIDEIAGTIKAQLAEVGLTVPQVLADEKNIEEIKKFVSMPEAFYKFVLARDRVFSEKLTTEMNRAGVKKSAVVIGGFHTETVRNILNEQGFQTILVRPVVTKDDPDAKKIYLERMMDSQFNPDRVMLAMGLKNTTPPLATAFAQIVSGFMAEINRMRAEMGLTPQEVTKIAEADLGDLAGFRDALAALVKSKGANIPRALRDFITGEVNGKLKENNIAEIELPPEQKTETPPLPAPAEGGALKVPGSADMTLPARKFNRIIDRNDPVAFSAVQLNETLKSVGIKDREGIMDKIDIYLTDKLPRTMDSYGKVVNGRLVVLINKAYIGEDEISQMHEASYIRLAEVVDHEWTEHMTEGGNHRKAAARQKLYFTQDGKTLTPYHEWVIGRMTRGQLSTVKEEYKSLTFSDREERGWGIYEEMFYKAVIKRLGEDKGFIRTVSGAVAVDMNQTMGGNVIKGIEGEDRLLAGIMYNFNVLVSKWFMPGASFGSMDIPGFVVVFTYTMYLCGFYSYRYLVGGERAVIKSTADLLSRAGEEAGIYAANAMKSLGKRSANDEDAVKFTQDELESFTKLPRGVERNIPGFKRTKAVYIEADGESMKGLPAHQFILNKKRYIVINKDVGEEVQKEGVFHEEREIYWMRQGFSQHRAHIVASAEQEQKFTKGGLTQYHINQLMGMPVKQLRAIAEETEADRKFHHDVLKAANKKGAKINVEDVKSYEESLRALAKLRAVILELNLSADLAGVIFGWLVDQDTKAHQMSFLQPDAACIVRILKNAEALTANGALFNPIKEKFDGDEAKAKKAVILSVLLSKIGYGHDLKVRDAYRRNRINAVKMMRTNLSLIKSSAGLSDVQYSFIEEAVLREGMLGFGTELRYGDFKKAMIGSGLFTERSMPANEDKYSNHLTALLSVASEMDVSRQRLRGWQKEPALLRAMGKIFSDPVIVGLYLERNALEVEKAEKLKRGEGLKEINRAIGAQRAKFNKTLRAKVREKIINDKDVKSSRYYYQIKDYVSKINSESYLWYAGTYHVLETSVSIDGTEIKIDNCETSPLLGAAINEESVRDFHYYRLQGLITRVNRSLETGISITKEEKFANEKLYRTCREAPKAELHCHLAMSLEFSMLWGGLLRYKKTNENEKAYDTALDASEKLLENLTGEEIDLKGILEEARSTAIQLNEFINAYTPSVGSEIRELPKNMDYLATDAQLLINTLGILEMEERIRIQKLINQYNLMRHYVRHLFNYQEGALTRFVKHFAMVSKAEGVLDPDKIGAMRRLTRDMLEGGLKDNVAYIEARFNVGSKKESTLAEIKAVIMEYKDWCDEKRSDNATIKLPELKIIMSVTKRVDMSEEEKRKTYTDSAKILVDILDEARSIGGNAYNDAIEVTGKDVLDYVIGVDAAGQEEGNPPELFEEAFKVFDGYNAKVGAGGKKLIKTFHIAESISDVSIESGIRYSVQAMTMLGMNRLGHNIIPAIPDFDQFLGQTRTERVSERIAQIKFDLELLDLGVPLVSVTKEKLKRQLEYYKRRQKENPEAEAIVKYDTKEKIQDLKTRAAYALDMAIRLGVIIETNPSSNLGISPYLKKSYEEHTLVTYLKYEHGSYFKEMLAALRAKGDTDGSEKLEAYMRKEKYDEHTGQKAKVTVGTDDLTLFGTTLSEEFYRIAEAQGLSPQDTLELIKNGFTYADAMSQTTRDDSIAVIDGIACRIEPAHAHFGLFGETHAPIQHVFIPHRNLPQERQTVLTEVKAIKDDLKVNGTRVTITYQGREYPQYIDPNVANWLGNNIEEMTQAMIRCANFAENRAVALGATPQVPADMAWAVLADAGALSGNCIGGDNFGYLRQDLVAENGALDRLAKYFISCGIKNGYGIARQILEEVFIAHEFAHEFTKRSDEEFENALRWQDVRTLDRILNPLYAASGNTWENDITLQQIFSIDAGVASTISTLRANPAPRVKNKLSEAATVRLQRSSAGVTPAYVMQGGTVTVSNDASIPVRAPYLNWEKVRTMLDWTGFFAPGSLDSLEISGLVMSNTRGFVELGSIYIDRAIIEKYPYLFAMTLIHEAAHTNLGGMDGHHGEFYCRVIEAAFFAFSGYREAIINELNAYISDMSGQAWREDLMLQMIAYRNFLNAIPVDATLEQICLLVLNFYTGEYAKSQVRSFLVAINKLQSSGVLLYPKKELQGLERKIGGYMRALKDREESGYLSLIGRMRNEGMAEEKVENTHCVLCEQYNPMTRYELRTQRGVYLGSIFTRGVRMYYKRPDGTDIEIIQGKWSLGGRGGKSDLLTGGGETEVSREHFALRITDTGTIQIFNIGAANGLNIDEKVKIGFLKVRTKIVQLVGQEGSGVAQLSLENVIFGPNGKAVITIPVSKDVFEEFTFDMDSEYQGVKYNEQYLKPLIEKARELKASGKAERQIYEELKRMVRIALSKTLLSSHERPAKLDEVKRLDEIISRGQTKVPFGYYIMTQSGYCRHYARLFGVLAKEAGLEASAHVGQWNGERHAWDNVIVEGKRYTLDIFNDIEKEIPDNLTPDQQREVQKAQTGFDQTSMFSAGEQPTGRMSVMPRMRGPDGNQYPYRFFSKDMPSPYYELIIYGPPNTTAKLVDILAIDMTRGVEESEGDYDFYYDPIRSMYCWEKRFEAGTQAQQADEQPTRNLGASSLPPNMRKRTPDIGQVVPLVVLPNLGLADLQQSSDAPLPGNIRGLVRNIIQNYSAVDLRRLREFVESEYAKPTHYARASRIGAEGARIQEIGERYKREELGDAILSSFVEKAYDYFNDETNVSGNTNFGRYCEVILEVIDELIRSKVGTDAARLSWGIPPKGYYAETAGRLNNDLVMEERTGMMKLEIMRQRNYIRVQNPDPEAGKKDIIFYKDTRFGLFPIKEPKLKLSDEAINRAIESAVKISAERAAKMGISARLPDHIVLALLDRSPNFAENHTRDGFVGINKYVTDVLIPYIIKNFGEEAAERFMSLLICHELTHEATGFGDEIEVILRIMDIMEMDNIFGGVWEEKCTGLMELLGVTKEDVREIRASAPGFTVKGMVGKGFLPNKMIEDINEADEGKRVLFDVPVGDYKGKITYTDIEDIDGAAEYSNPETVLKYIVRDLKQNSAVININTAQYGEVSAMIDERLAGADKDLSDEEIDAKIVKLRDILDVAFLRAVRRLDTYDKAVSIPYRVGFTMLERSNELVEFIGTDIIGVNRVVVDVILPELEKKHGKKIADNFLILLFERKLKGIFTGQYAEGQEADIRDDLMILGDIMSFTQWKEFFESLDDELAREVVEIKTAKPNVVLVAEDSEDIPSPDEVVPVKRTGKAEKEVIAPTITSPNPDQLAASGEAEPAFILQDGRYLKGEGVINKKWAWWSDKLSGDGVKDKIALWDLWINGVELTNLKINFTYISNLFAYAKDGQIWMDEGFLGNPSFLAVTLMHEIAEMKAGQYGERGIEREIISSVVEAQFFLLQEDDFRRKVLREIDGFIEYLRRTHPEDTRFAGLRKHKAYLEGLQNAGLNPADRDSVIRHIITYIEQNGSETQMQGLARVRRVKRAFGAQTISQKIQSIEQGDDIDLGEPVDDENTPMIIDTEDETTTAHGSGETLKAPSTDEVGVAEKVNIESFIAAKKDEGKVSDHEAEYNGTKYTIHAVDCDGRYGLPKFDGAERPQDLVYAYGKMENGELHIYMAKKFHDTFKDNKFMMDFVADHEMGENIRNESHADASKRAWNSEFCDSTDMNVFYKWYLDQLAEAGQDAEVKAFVADPEHKDNDNAMKLKRYAAAKLIVERVKALRRTEISDEGKLIKEIDEALVGLGADVNLEKMLRVLGLTSLTNADFCQIMFMVSDVLDPILVGKEKGESSQILEAVLGSVVNTFGTEEGANNDEKKYFALTNAIKGNLQYAVNRVNALMKKSVNISDNPTAVIVDYADVVMTNTEGVRVFRPGIKEVLEMLGSQDVFVIRADDVAKMQDAIDKAMPGVKDRIKVVSKADRAEEGLAKGTKIVWMTSKSSGDEYNGLMRKAELGDIKLVQMQEGSIFHMTLLFAFMYGKTGTDTDLARDLVKKFYGLFGDEADLEDALKGIDNGIVTVKLVTMKDIVDQIVNTRKYASTAA